MSYECQRRRFQFQPETRSTSSTPQQISETQGIHRLFVKSFYKESLREISYGMWISLQKKRREKDGVLKAGEEKSERRARRNSIHHDRPNYSCDSESYYEMFLKKSEMRKQQFLSSNLQILHLHYLKSLLKHFLCQTHS
ncbi:hypothetical protein F2P79_014555 [Pimephales promelas]|nr:hypothetical protein F2P79_014555 [Pimephales promelas]